MTSPEARWIRLGRAIPVATAAALLWACSGGEQGASSAGTAPDEVVGHAPRAAGGMPAVVLLYPLDPGAPARTESSVGEGPVMDQYLMQFSPPVVLARPGQTVTFTNSDDTPHIVTVRSTALDSTLFSEGTDMGSRLEHTFAQVGVYDVSCGMHPGMAGVVLVHEAPYAVVADRDGAFRIPDVPPGTYRRVVWSADPNSALTDTVEVARGRTVVPD